MPFFLFFSMITEVMAFVEIVSFHWFFLSLTFEKFSLGLKLLAILCGYLFIIAVLSLFWSIFENSEDSLFGYKWNITWLFYRFDGAVVFAWKQVAC